MFVFMCIIMLLAGILLVAAVLLQPGKGAGLSGFGGATGQLSNMFGARRTSDFLQKFTLGLALGILLLAVITNKFFVSPAKAVVGAEERTPITAGAAKPAPQPAPQQMQQQAPVQQAPVQQAPAQGQGQPAPSQAPAQGKPAGK
jgi:preprotein translocase subunit SecG